MGRILCRLGWHLTHRHITAWGLYRRHCIRCEKTIPGWY